MAEKERSITLFSIPVSLLMTLLTVMFIYMKLAHVGDVADWSWLMVLCPLWIGAALIIAPFILIVVILVVLFIWQLLAAWLRKR